MNDLCTFIGCREEAAYFCESEEEKYVLCKSHVLDNAYNGLIIFNAHKKINPEIVEDVLEKLKKEIDNLKKLDENINKSFNDIENIRKNIKECIKKFSNSLKYFKREVIKHQRIFHPKTNFRWWYP